MPSCFLPCHVSPLEEEEALYLHGLSCAKANNIMIMRETHSELLKALTVLKELENACATPLECLKNVGDALIEEMKAGLALEGEGGSTVKMLLSFVDSLPSGEEKGLYYALDLGGTNFRVLRVQLGGGGNNAVFNQEVSIPNQLMHGTTEDLFDFIATQLVNFVLQDGDESSSQTGKERELGFTFSFPVKQTSINSGTLIKWTKGFTIEGTAGMDVVKTLQEALHRQGLANMRVTALVNDTVGTLAVAALDSLKARKQEVEEVMIAVILGTGTNACYVECITSIPKWHGPVPQSGSMVINTEWGGFSSPHLPISQYDLALDSNTVNPGEQRYEKLISGLYLGDLVRRVLLRIAGETTLLGETIPLKLQEPFKLTSPDVCYMHNDNSDDLEKVGEILDTLLGIKAASLEARKLVVAICNVVTRRAGRLAGAGIVAILKKIGRDEERNRKTIVAMDGGLYEHYTQFREYLQSSVVELLGENQAKNVKIELSKDGSGIGAAILAAAQSRVASHPKH